MSTDYITIQLSKRSRKKSGKYQTIIDIVDADLGQYNWHVINNRKVDYALRTAHEMQGKPTIWIHRLILGRMLGRDLLPIEYVDHIDGDGLNNRRSNLRLANRYENQRNRPKNSNNKSGCKGVSWYNNKWVAQICVDGKNQHIGRFDKLEDACKAYNDKAKELHGEFANTGE